MDLDATMQDALAQRPDVSALACMDGRAGLVLGMYVRGERMRDLIEVAALSAPQLCVAPDFGEGFGEGVEETEGEAAEAPSAFVASDEWVHAYVRVADRPDLVVVGLAKAGTSVALLRSWLGEVADQVGRTA